RCSRANTSKIVRRLERVGALRTERRQVVAKRRGRRPLYLTTMGYETYKRAKAQMLDQAEHLFGMLERREIEAMVTLVERVARESLLRIEEQA
ncbi:MAG: hypothetical protein KF850_14070, partial [Labilithrix sp.]|nr:hypothetical protein [Labilithrix sp.]